MKYFILIKILFLLILANAFSEWQEINTGINDIPGEGVINLGMLRRGVYFISVYENNSLKTSRKIMVY